MYFNTLIIMNEDTSGYGNRSRKPSGYCKLAMPNKIICYAQGLRQLPKGQVYRLYLTSKSKDQSVEVGMFQVGASGNKETRWLMDPSSINNSDINAKEIDGALIKVDGDNVKEQLVPLVGFSTEPYRWEHLLKVETIKENLKPIQKVAVEVAKPKVAQVEVAKIEVAKVETIKAEVEQVAEIEQEPPMQEPPVQVSMRTEQDEILLLKEEVKELKSTIKESKETIKRLQKDQEDYNAQKLARIAEVEMEKDAKVLALKEEVEKLNSTIRESKEIRESLQEDQKDHKAQNPVRTVEVDGEMEKVTGINEYINNFIRKFQAGDRQEQKKDFREAESIFEMRIPINPFELRNTDVKWVRITYDDLAALPSLSHEWINQPLIMNANKDYKHFILGRDKSGLTYYLGIPGIFDSNEKNGLNIDKIERFSCCHNVVPRTGEAGYWIARI